MVKNEIYRSRRPAPPKTSGRASPARRQIVSGYDRVEQPVITDEQTAINRAQSGAPVGAAGPLLVSLVVDKTKTCVTETSDFNIRLMVMIPRRSVRSVTHCRRPGLNDQHQVKLRPR
jgi:hypothetical protein